MLLLASYSASMAANAFAVIDDETVIGHFVIIAVKLPVVTSCACLYNRGV